MTMRRGLTLIEILLVIALLLALAATAAPALFGVMEGRALDVAGDTVSQQLMLARAHAQRSGRPVEVSYRDDPPRVVARYFDVGERAASDGERRDAMGHGNADPFVVGDNHRAAETDGDALTWHWARRDLPARITISSTPPNDQDTPRSTQHAAPSAQHFIRLAVFMSDGSAPLAREAWIIGGDRAKRLVVNPWTGLATVEPHMEESGKARKAASDERRFPP